MNKLLGKYRCKHCHVPVLGKKDFRPIFGRSHLKSCPRKRMYG